MQLLLKCYFIFLKDTATQIDVEETMNIPEIPVIPATVGGSGIFQKPLKQKTSTQQLNDRLSELLKRHERQEETQESDRELLGSLVSSVNQAGRLFRKTAAEA